MLSVVYLQHIRHGRTGNVANTDQLLQRNKDFAATGAHETASIIARHQVYVITCLDPRTDVSAFLELQLGDAMVVRNAGGRVSADVLKDLAYIGYLASTLVPGGPRFEVAVVHHNQCGTHFLADDKFRRGFADLRVSEYSCQLRRHRLTTAGPSPCRGRSGLGAGRPSRLARRAQRCCRSLA
jgi:carbonic anhydrase